MLEASKQNNIPAKNIWIFDPIGQPIPAGQRSWRDLLKFGEADWVRFDDADRSKTAVAARLFSSGTTGLPKGVNITHQNLIAQHELTATANPKPFDVRQLSSTSSVCY